MRHQLSSWARPDTHLMLVAALAAHLAEEGAPRLAAAARASRAVPRTPAVGLVVQHRYQLTPTGPVRMTGPAGIRVTPHPLVTAGATR